jgi:hypothetical protein
VFLSVTNAHRKIKRYGRIYFNQCIWCNGILLQEFNIVIGFVVLYVKKLGLCFKWNTL